MFINTLERCKVIYFEKLIILMLLDVTLDK